LSVIEGRTHLECDVATGGAAGEAFADATGGTKTSGQNRVLSQARPSAEVTSCYAARLGAARALRSAAPLLRRRLWRVHHVRVCEGCAL